MTMLTHVPVIDQESLAEFAEFFIKIRGNLFEFGPAGIGKTEIPIQVATRLGFRSVYLNLSVLEAPDLMGLPYIDETTRTAMFAPPSNIPLYDPSKDDSPIVLVVDEADKAKPELQNPMLELYQSHSMNGRKFNIQAIISTGNLPDENAHSQPVSHALTNRCGIFHVSPKVEPWITWASRNDVHPLVIQYLTKHPEELYVKSSSGDITEYANRSPRSWSMASNALKHTDSSATVDFQAMLVASFIGTAAAVKFKVWLDHLRHIEPHIADLVESGVEPPFSMNQDPQRLLICATSAAAAIKNACAQKVSSADERKKVEHVRRVVMNVSKWMDMLPREVCVGAMKSVMTMQHIRDYKLANMEEFTKIFQKVRDVMLK